MEKVDIDSLQFIHQNSVTPFILFDENKVVQYANDSFVKKFNFKDIKRIKGCIIDFIYHKEEDDDFLPFYQIENNRIVNDTLIYTYFDLDNFEHFYYITSFYIGKFNNKKYYYSLCKEITDLEERLMQESINALVKASRLKDNDTGNHVLRVNAYAYSLTKYLYKTRSNLYPEIDSEFIHRIVKVSSMHDIGKIGIPDYILTKSGKLTHDEFNIMKEHTINGAFILSKLAGQMARDIALFHHEKWDGTGYPYQLKDLQIPLSARIVALSDVYDALRMERHYKPKFSHKEAVKIILEKRNTHFESEIVDAFIEIEDEFNDIFENMSDEKKIKLYHIDTDL